MRPREGQVTGTAAGTEPWTSSAGLQQLAEHASPARHALPVSHAVGDGGTMRVALKIFLAAVGFEGCRHVECALSLC